ncbi:MAG TPA: hypothetical protein VLA92_01615 [Candidatus Saccharimonadales bacterium]|nr:hypothetical protein [Candidatus Saccharimonadales bacterium]
MPKTPTANKKEVQEPRQLKAGKYKSFKLQKRIKPVSNKLKLPNVFQLLRGTFSVMRKNWKVFLGIILIYGVLNLVLVQSFSATDVGQTKENLDTLNTGRFSNVVSSLMLFLYMASSSGNINNTTAGAYQLMLTVITSLALIWTFRQVYAQKPARIRDGFYWGMYPLVPFILVIGVAMLQLLPIVVGGYMYNLVTTGIVATGIETTLWAILLVLLALASLYMLTATLFALYIVCLPDVTPRQALRSARELVQHRRWTIMRKILFLPLFLFIAAILLIVPLIFVAPVIASLTFLLTSMFGLPVIHGYMYRLYRELL